MRRAWFCLAAFALTALPVQAGPDCQCLANGKSYSQGEVACLKLPGGRQLARCEMVLNNTSWKSTGQGCPQASQTPAKVRQTKSG
mgnify:CR=1 FL=1